VVPQECAGHLRRQRGATGRSSRTSVDAPPQRQVVVEILAHLGQPAGRGGVARKSLLRQPQLLTQPGQQHLVQDRFAGRTFRFGRGQLGQRSLLRGVQADGEITDGPDADQVVGDQPLDVGSELDQSDRGGEGHAEHTEHDDTDGHGELQAYRSPLRSGAS
jgi:hypothetical protein